MKLFPANSKKSVISIKPGYSINFIQGLIPNIITVPLLKLKKNNIAFAQKPFIFKQLQVNKGSAVDSV